MLIVATYQKITCTKCKKSSSSTLSSLTSLPSSSRSSLQVFRTNSWERYVILLFILDKNILITNASNIFSKCSIEDISNEVKLRKSGARSKLPTQMSQEDVEVTQYMADDNY